MTRTSILTEVRYAKRRSAKKDDFRSLVSRAMTGYRTRTGGYYVVVVGALLLIVTKSLPKLLPHGIATQIGHNSESLLFAVGFCGIAQFALPALRAAGRSIWPIAVPSAAACFVLGYLLIHSGWRSSIVTLNEAVIAVGFMWLYVAIPRPFRYAPLVAIAVFAFVVIFFDRGSFVLDQAESLVPAMLAPIALDVMDRTILEPELPDNKVPRIAWMVLLVVVAVGLIGAARWARKDLHGPLKVGIDYGQRAAEAYYGWLLVHAYFGFWIGRARGWVGRAARVGEASLVH